jgi:ATP-binding cassette subfamily F protein 3
MNENFPPRLPRVPVDCAPMVSYSGTVLRCRPRELLRDASFMVECGWRVGVIGRNGTGKTNLFAMILNEFTLDAGEVSLPKEISIATVAQEMSATNQTAVEYTLDGDNVRFFERGHLLVGPSD